MKHRNDWTRIPHISRKPNNNHVNVMSPMCWTYIMLGWIISTRTIARKNELYDTYFKGGNTQNSLFYVRAICGSHICRISWIGNHLEHQIVESIANTWTKKNLLLKINKWLYRADISYGCINGLKALEGWIRRLFFLINSVLYQYMSYSWIYI